ncbi:MAG TPA: TIGR04076 family protein [Candidatus Bathyarchaeia archaeon]|nr:TIGR04076 family protein [Candidatus Bathyarchaeia archaeon]
MVNSAERIKVTDMTYPNPYKVIATIKSISNPCSSGHKVGESFEFDGMELKGRLCTDAFDAIYRNVAIMMWGGEVPWMRGKDKILLNPCPDAHSQVIFELKRVKKEKKP